MCLRLAFLAVSAFLLVPAVAQSFITPNPLLGLPGRPGPTVAAIQAMADNSYLNLGAPAPDSNQLRLGREGVARGAAYGERSLVLAPELRGAFRTGEGDHAFVKSDGFGQDDFWFYDINGHRWICLFPGTDTRNFNQMVLNNDIVVDSNGQAVDTAGQPVPGHLNIHAWGSLAYDTDSLKFVFGGGPSFQRYYMPGVDLIDQGLDTLEARGLNSGNKRFCPWAYNSQTGKFERELLAAESPSPDPGGFGQVIYIPEKKKFFLAANLGVTYFDPATRTWDPLVQDTTHPTDWTYDFGACHDTKRNRIYMGQTADNFYWHDLATGEWSKIANPNAYPVRFRSVYGAIVYDSQNDVILIFSWVVNDGGAGNNIVYPFFPETNTWGVPTTYPGPASVSYPTNAVFYDPELGVTFIYTAGDSRDNGVMGVYCYKQTAGAEKTRLGAKGAVLSAMPNPFNPSVTLTLTGVPAGNPSIRVYDLSGRLVADISGSMKEARASWNAAGRASGVYTVIVQSGNLKLMEKITLIR